MKQKWRMMGDLWAVEGRTGGEELRVEEDGATGVWVLWIVRGWDKQVKDDRDHGLRTMPGLNVNLSNPHSALEVVHAFMRRRWV